MSARSPDALRVFGYGSLTFAPASSGRLVSLLPARLTGVRRAFNKRSRSRSAPAAACFDAPGVAPAFDADPRPSLTLGTAPGGSLRGLVAHYEGDLDALIAELDAREGFDPGAGRENGYVRRTVQLDCGPAVAYLTNPDPTCPWTLRPAPSPDQAARILIHGTPRGARSDGPRAPGLDYLRATRAALAQVGIVDDELEAVAAAVWALPGPWSERAGPRPR